MSRLKLAGFTLLHFVAACAFWLAAFSTSLGLGFKAEWDLFDYLFSAASIAGAAILTFPVWLFTFLSLPSWFSYVLLPAQLGISFLQVKLGYWLYRGLKRRNK